MAIVSLSAVKDSLGLQAAETEADLALLRWISSATSAVESYLSQPAERQAIDAVFSGVGESERVIGYYPIRLLDEEEPAYSMTRKGALGEEDIDLEAGTDFDLVDYVEGLYMLRYPSGFDDGVVYKLSIQVGYLEADIPPDISEAALRLVVAMAKDSKLAAVGDNRAGLASRSVSRRDGITTGETILRDETAIRSLLDPYRRHSHF